MKPPASAQVSSLPELEICFPGNQPLHGALLPGKAGASFVHIEDVVAAQVAGIGSIEVQTPFTGMIRPRVDAISTPSQRGSIFLLSRDNGLDLL